MKSILKFYYILSGMNVTYTAVPLLVTLVTFATYIHIDPVNNVVTAEKVTLSKLCTSLNPLSGVCLHCYLQPATPTPLPVPNVPDEGCQASGELGQDQ